MNTTKRFGLLAASILMLMDASASAQETNLYKPAAKSQSPSQEVTPANCTARLPFSQWVGQKVVFQAKTQQFAKYGYQSYRVANPAASITTPYSVLAGKVATVEKIGPSDSIGFRDVTLRLDQTGEAVTTQSLNDVLPNAVLLADIQDTKSRWVGKTLWYNQKYVRLSQDVQEYEGKVVRKFQPVKVLDAIVGVDLISQVDFVVQLSDGTEGLIAANVSASNFSESTLKIFEAGGRTACNFKEQFNTVDPRTEHKWSPAMWSAIESETVLVGMNVEQAMMAWGKPHDVNETKTANTYQAQWVYKDRGNFYVDDNGKVTAIQQ